MVLILHTHPYTKKRKESEIIFHPPAMNFLMTIHYSSNSLQLEPGDLVLNKTWCGVMSQRVTNTAQHRHRHDMLSELGVQVFKLQWESLRDEDSPL